MARNGIRRLAMAMKRRKLAKGSGFDPATSSFSIQPTKRSNKPVPKPKKRPGATGTASSASRVGTRYRRPGSTR